MLKNILISSVLSVTSATSLSNINFSSEKKTHYTWDTADFSQLAFNNKEGKSHSVTDWNSTTGMGNDYNFLYSDIVNVSDKYETTFQNKTKFKLSKAIDNTIKQQEGSIFGEYNVFYNQVLKSPDSIYISVEDEDEDSFESLNSPSTTFQDTEHLDQDFQTSLYLRVSNKSSTDWSENKSYFDVDVNICNFSNDSKTYDASTDWNITKYESNHSGSDIVNPGSSSTWYPFKNDYPPVPAIAQSNPETLAYYENVILSFDVLVNHTSNDKHSDFRNAWIGGGEGKSSFSHKSSGSVIFTHYTTDTEKKTLPMDDQGKAKNEGYYYHTKSIFMDDYLSSKIAKCNLEEGLYFNYSYDSGYQDRDWGINVSPSWKFDETDAITNKLRTYRARSFTEDITISSIKLSISLNSIVFS